MLRHASRGRLVHGRLLRGMHGVESRATIRFRQRAHRRHGRAHRLLSSVVWRSPWCSADGGPTSASGTLMSRATRTAAVAWLVTAVYYFYQYTLRSAPAVMMPQLSEAFGLSATGVASMVGLFYYGYSPFSLVAGVAMDRLGPRKVVPIGAAAVGIGALLFATGNSAARQRRPVPAGRRRRVRAGRRRLHRDDELSRRRARRRSSARRRCSAWPAARPASSSSGR